MTSDTVTTEEMLDQAIAELGTLEIVAGHRRIYFDDLMGWLRMEFERDESGKIVSATRGGEPVTTAYAIRIENQIKRARLYYDLDERVFRGQGLDSINRGDLSQAITARAEEMLAESDVESTASADGDEALA